MSEIDYAARVARGIALMDEKWPNWATEIDLEKLDIKDGTRCMTAQYSAARDGSGGWRDGMYLLGLNMDSYTEHGFKTEDENQGDYPTLNALWQAEILRRRTAASESAPAEPEAGA